MNLKSNPHEPLLLIWKREVASKPTLRKLQTFKQAWKERIRTQTPELTSLERAQLIDWIDANFVVTHKEIDPLDAIVHMTNKYPPTKHCNADTVEEHDLAFLRILSSVYKLGACNVQQIHMTINTDKDVVDKIEIFRNVSKTLREVIESCAKSGQQVVVISLFLIYEQLQDAHANMLIINTADKTVERFEPHGSRTYSNKDITTLVDDTLTGFIELHMPLGYSYIPPTIVCAKGPQSDTRYTKKCKDDPDRGFCLVWSVVYAHLRMLAPTLPYDRIWSMLSKMAADPKFVRRYLTMMEVTIKAHVEELDNDDTLLHSPIPAKASNVKTVNNMYGL